VVYGSNGFAIFYGGVAIGDDFLYSGQAIHLNYSMGGACGKVTTQMVECGTWIMLWFNELIFSMHWLINGVNEGLLACTME
jgi:hypothetical protein